MTHPPMNATILVVEDDAATSEFLLDLLEMEGYRTRHAASGHAALGVLMEHPINAVLLDRRLPDMDGLEVCREIRRTIHATLPIILLTAEYDVELEAAATRAGITKFMSKPFPPDRLIDQVAALIRS